MTVRWRSAFPTEYTYAHSLLGSNWKSSACRYEQRPEAESVSNRRRVEWVRDIEAGDELDFVLHPRGTHACDGMSVIDIIIWPAAASAA